MYKIGHITPKIKYIRETRSVSRFEQVILYVIYFIFQ